MSVDWLGGSLPVSTCTDSWTCPAGGSAGLGCPRWLHAHAWKFVLAVGWAALVFFHVAFHPPGGWTGFLMWWSQGGFQERESGSYKASSGRGLEATRRHPRPFHWSKRIRVSREGYTLNTGRCISLVPFCNDLPHQVKEKHRLDSNSG